MTPNPTRRPAIGGWARLVLYYMGLALVLVLLVRSVPVVRQAVSGAAAAASGGDLFGPDAPPVGTELPSSPWHQALLAVTSMLGALAVMVPVAWVYMITRRHRGYLESVLHTLLILPIAVTGIVMIVGTNVALAFALAGIVAAVRFRTTLEDTKDAVYVFLAIGVGIASGVQALGIALALSVVFNVVVLVLWRTKFGNPYAGAAGTLGLGDALAGPGSAASALTVGDPAILEAAAPASLAEVADRASRLERHVSEERSKKKSKRANSLLLVHAAAAAPAQERVEPLLSGLASSWKLAEVGPGPSGFLLVYLARLDGTAAQAAIMDRIKDGDDGVIAAAELRSLEGLRPRT